MAPGVLNSLLNILNAILPFPLRTVVESQLINKRIYTPRVSTEDYDAKRYSLSNGRFQYSLWAGHHG